MLGRVGAGTAQGKRERRVDLGMTRSVRSLPLPGERPRAMPLHGSAITYWHCLLAVALLVAVSIVHGLDDREIAALEILASSVPIIRMEIGSSPISTVCNKTSPRTCPQATDYRVFECNAEGHLTKMHVHAPLPLYLSLLPY